MNRRTLRAAGLFKQRTSQATDQIGLFLHPAAELQVAVLSAKFHDFEGLRHAKNVFALEALQQKVFELAARVGPLPSDLC